MIDREKPADPFNPPNGDLLEFMDAMQDYRERSGRMFPTWSEVLEVLLELGYRKPESPTKRECA